MTLAASFTGTETTIRIFELVSLVLFAAGLVWVIRLRTPLYLGAFVGATLVWAFDWSYSTNGFFHVTFNEHLIPIPGLNNQGITEPISIPMNYAIGFALPAILWAQNDEMLRRRFGKWRHLLILAAGAVGVGIYEIPVVHVLGIWTYHQRPEFLILGFPWSNFWYAAGLLGGSAILLAYVRRWTQAGDDAAGWGGAERVWRGIVLGAMPIWAAFYLSYLVQLFWYANAHPWTTPYLRPF